MRFRLFTGELIQCMAILQLDGGGGEGEGGNECCGALPNGAHWDDPVADMLFMLAAVAVLLSIGRVRRKT